MKYVSEFNAVCQVKMMKIRLNVQIKEDYSFFSSLISSSISEITSLL